MITASVSLSGTFSSGTISSPDQHSNVLNYFSVKGRMMKAPLIREVSWIPPSWGWYKCNIDGSAKGCPGIVACGGIFRDGTGSILGCFALNIGISFSLHAKFLAAIKAIELAFEKCWRKIWIESDSSQVVAALKSNSISLVPWKLRNRW